MFSAFTFVHFPASTAMGGNAEKGMIMVLPLRGSRLGCV